MPHTLHFQHTLVIHTRGRGLVDITAQVAEVVAESRVSLGLATVFCQHTSASLLIQENADPTAARDLLAWFERLAPDGDPAYEHAAEGPDDMPSHLRSAVTRTSETIPIAERRLNMGTWQGLYLFEHRLRPQTRRVVVHCMGL